MSEKISASEKITTSERINTPFTNEHFAAFCLSMIGHPYWYGCCGYKATSSLLSRKTSQYPSHYGSSRTARYKQDIANNEVVCDCIGGAKGYAWSGGGQSMLAAIGTDKAVSSSYGSHGCPDKGANGMFTYAKSKGCAWGTIGTLPEIIGLALYKDGHVGYYVGGGYAVEWQGFAYGCVKTKVSKRPWTHWYQLPFIDYGTGAITGDGSASGQVTGKPADTAATEYTLGSRTLQKGSKGTDVKTLQEILLQVGCELPKYGADGDYGSETLTAVTAFQRNNGIKADGIYGSETHAKLMDVVAEKDGAQPEAPGQGEQPSQPTQGDAPVVQPDVSTPRSVTIVCSSGTVNIRTGNDTKYARITAVKSGAPFPWIATAVNGWHAVVVNGQVGWVSGQYSKLV